MFETKLSLEERIARTETQLAKAKHTRKKALERAQKLERKLTKLVAKRSAAEPSKLPVVSAPAKKPGRRQQQVGA